MQTSYAIALGSNVPHSRYGAPAKVLRAALGILDTGPLSLVAASRIICSAPVGPSQRVYANAAAIIETSLQPEALLAHFKQIERDFGRRARGQRWSARPLDLDILLWSQGAFLTEALCIPHREMAQRVFVLDPLARIAPHWRHPLSGLTILHMKARLDQKRPAA